MSTIHDIDDPRLTAYALGELELAEVPAVEAFLADNAEARAAVEATRALAGTLSAELMGELSGAAGDAGAPDDAAEETGLDAGRRQALVQAAAEGAPGSAGTAPGADASPVRPVRRITSLRPFLAAAAVLLLGVFVADQVLRGPGSVGSDSAPAASRPAPPVAVLESQGPKGANRLSKPWTASDDGTDLDLRARGAVPNNTAYPSGRSGEKTLSPDREREFVQRMQSLGYTMAEAPASSVAVPPERYEEFAEQLRVLGYNGGEAPLTSDARRQLQALGDSERTREEDGSELTPAQRDELRSLGYGAGSGASGDEASRQLAALGYASDAAPDRSVNEPVATRQALESLGYVSTQAGTEPSAPATPEGSTWDLGDELALQEDALQSYQPPEEAFVGAMVGEAEVGVLFADQGGGGGGDRVDAADGYVPPSDSGAGAAGATVSPPGAGQPPAATERGRVAVAGLPATSAPADEPVIITIEGGVGGSGSTTGGAAPAGQAPEETSVVGIGGASAPASAGAPQAPGGPTRAAQEAAVITGRGQGGRSVSRLGGKLARLDENADADDLLGRAGIDVDAEAAAPVALADAPAELQLRALGYLSDDGRDRSARDAVRWRSRHLGGESYAPIHENPFVPLTRDPLSALSTFGVDVDRASYANVRRFLHANQAPPADAVRIEELVNAFAYDDPAPEGEHPFAVSVEAAACPWEPRHRLVKVGLSTAQVEAEERAPVQLVFLLDVSGSMKDDDKLPLLIHSLDLLLDELDERDRVAIVTYASGAQVVLPSTSCAEKDTIRAALKSLRADGSTHASAGIELAYQVAAEGFVQGGNNRVLLATDGDFNVGVTGHTGLQQLIATKAAGGVFLTVLGFGTGNYKDDTAELLADKGNGQYAYIDSLNEAHRVLVAEMEATLVTVAKDVKVQVEFNPAHVAAYRLIGYENRALAAADFRNDRKDAGEIGAGHSVTALYEIRPTGLPPLEGTAELKYQAPPADAAPPVVSGEVSPELLTVNLRYKQPDGDTGIELAVPFTDRGAAFAEADEDFRFAAAVAAFGMILRGSDHAGAASLEWVRQVAEVSRSFDPHGDRAEFVRLVRTAQGLLGR